MSAPYRIEPLFRGHDRRAFDCGVPELNRYLRERASQDVRNSVAVCYVLVRDANPVVLGYVTLSAATIELTNLPAEVARRLPRYPLLPAALIGRLAVDQQVRGAGFGEMLLMDALRRCLTIRNQIGILAVLVDAKDDAVASFYARYGFAPLRTIPQRLFLPLTTVAATFAE